MVQPLPLQVPAFLRAAGLPGLRSGLLGLFLRLEALLGRGLFLGLLRLGGGLARRGLGVGGALFRKGERLLLLRQLLTLGLGAVRLPR